MESGQYNRTEVLDSKTYGTKKMFKAILLYYSDVMAVPKIEMLPIEGRKRLGGQPMMKYITSIDQKEKSRMFSHQYPSLLSNLTFSRINLVGKAHTTWDPEHCEMKLWSPRMARKPGPWRPRSWRRRSGSRDYASSVSCI